MDKPNIGFIGTGIMGAPMSTHIARAGYAVTVYDIVSENAQKAAADQPGMIVASSPKEVAQASQIVFTMLPSGKYVQEAVLGESGLIEGFSEGDLLVDTSSCEPWLTLQTAETLAPKGVAMVDAPVSGAQPGAVAAELVFMVGGTPASVERARPLFNVMGKQLFHLGPHRFRTRHEVHQQPDHCHDFHGDHGRIYHREKVRPRPRGDDRRGECLHGHVVDQPDPYQAAHPEPRIR